MKTKFDNSGAVECELTGNEYDALLAKAAALDVAVAGLRELETTWAADAEAIESADATSADIIRLSAAAVSDLLDKIGATR